MIEPLFRDIDRRWRRTAETKTLLRIIGSTALMLQSDYRRGTKDSDVLETAHIDEATSTQLRSLAGVKTDLHKKHRLYVDVVAAGVPFLPQAPNCHLMSELSESLEHFDVEVLDVVDVVVSKLKRFNANDVLDIDAMVSRDLVPHASLLDRFKHAVEFYELDARAVDLPRYVANLHAVERDMLLVPESDIALPAWV
jgi:hypothetical protein